MEFVTAAVLVVTRLWDCTTRHTVHMCNLKDNLTTLGNKMQELKNISEDVKRRVQLEEERGMEATNQVTGWYERVQQREIEVNQILEMGSQELEQKCFGCPKNFLSASKLGKMVLKRIDGVAELMREGRFEVVAERLLHAPVDEMPLEKTVGLQVEMLEMVWRFVEDENVGMIGVYGIGGVGKTTFLKKLNNEFRNRSHDFDTVIWVVVPRADNVERVQDAIRERLGLSGVKSWTAKATEIYNALSKKRFALFLDDVWKRIDLTDLGIPPRDNVNKSKIIFTTRSEEVCGHMEASKKIRLGCLTKEEALDLFRQKVGEETLNSHPEIQKLAEVAAGECGGLPLALTTIGRALASKKTVGEWKHVLKILKDFPSKLSGMGDDVFSTLKFSYDNLSSDTLKTCFIYCSLFPEDYNINIEELVNLWIREDLINDFCDIDEAHNQGLSIIGDLKLVCLLESGKSKKSVNMHDVLRDMALWLASDCGRNTNNFVVKSFRNQLVKGHEVAKWQDANRISLSGVQNLEVTLTPTFSNLVSVFVRDSSTLKTLPGELFCFMNVIKVLDLSHNSSLTQLPVEIGNLISLRYLNGSKTSITELPIGLTNLQRLKYLGLDHTRHLSVSRGQLASLSALQVLDMMECGVDLVPYVCDDILEELEKLEHLISAKITIRGADLQELHISTKLQSVVRGILFVECKGLISSFLNHVECLDVLEINRCLDLKELTVNVPKITGDQRWLVNLHSVDIYGCPSLEHLTWLIWAQSLRSLSISNCESIEEVIRVNDSGAISLEEDVGIFERLERLSLASLPRLRSVYHLPLLLPCLSDITVVKCPRLESFQLDPDSAADENRGFVSSTGVLKDRSGVDKLPHRRNRTLTHL